MKISPRQVDRLFTAAQRWKSQGSKSKWSTEVSKELWETVDDIERNLQRDKEYFGTKDIKRKLSEREVEKRVKEAREDGNRLWVHYVDRNGNLTERLVKPTSMTSFGFDAYCFVRQDARYFMYSKIVLCKVVGKEDNADGMVLRMLEASFRSNADKSSGLHKDAWMAAAKAVRGVIGGRDGEV